MYDVRERKVTPKNTCNTLKNAKPHNLKISDIDNNIATYTKLLKEILKTQLFINSNDSKKLVNELNIVKLDEKINSIIDSASEVNQLLAKLNSQELKLTLWPNNTEVQEEIKRTFSSLKIILAGTFSFGRQKLNDAFENHTMQEYYIDLKELKSKIEKVYLLVNRISGFNKLKTDKQKASVKS